MVAISEFLGLKIIFETKMIGYIKNSFVHRFVCKSLETMLPLLQLLLYLHKFMVTPYIICSCFRSGNARESSGWAIAAFG